MLRNWKVHIVSLRLKINRRNDDVQRSMIMLDDSDDPCIFDLQKRLNLDEEIHSVRAASVTNLLLTLRHDLEMMGQLAILQGSAISCNFSGHGFNPKKMRRDGL